MDHLQLIKFWPSRAAGRGSAAGRKFWLHLTTARAQCLRLSERFFHSFLTAHVQPVRSDYKYDLLLVSFYSYICSR